LILGAPAGFARPVSLMIRQNNWFTSNNPDMTYRRVVLPSALAALLLGLGGPAYAGVDPDPGEIVVRYTFDGGLAGAIADDTGNGHTLDLIAARGGTVQPVPHRDGQALRFPAKCTAKRVCPHVALQAPNSAGLNPGTRPLAFGAMILLAPSQTSRGQNILQKGYSTSSSQWKLQIDGAAGRPSCVLVGDHTGIKIVRSSVSVADGHWHAVACERAGSTLSVLVDGVTRGVRTVSPGLSIVNNRPLSIGGKGAFRDNDQFQGILDDVWVRIG